MLNNGALIADRYRLQRLIATGGMGQVWEALDTRLDRRVAVKVLKAEFSTDPTFRHRFRAEARTTAQLNHPGIAGIYDYGETMDPSGGEIAYLVMEFVQGEPLNAVLNRMSRLSVAQGLDMLEQTARALQVAHSAGVVHRDVKPGNILVTPTGQVKITDFGIAKAVDASPVTKTGMVMGTAQYIAPEQATGEDATAASDVYSLGVVGYEALAGQRPFTGEGALTVAMKHVRDTPPPLPADLPPNVRELIEITMAKDPQQRYATGGEFADAVAAVRSGRRPTPPGGIPVTPNIPTGATRVLPPGPTMIIPGQRADQPTTRYATPPQQPAAMTGATALLSGPQPPTTRPGAGAAMADDEPTGRFTNSQKALAGLGVGALILGAAAAFVLLSGSPPEPTPPTRTSAVVAPPVTAPPTTTAPLTTTKERPVPPPVTTYEPPVTTYEPPVTTTQPPVTTTKPPVTTTVPKTTTVPPTTTKDEEPSTVPPTTTKKPQPGVDLPSFPVIPGAGGGVRANTSDLSEQGQP